MVPWPGQSTLETNVVIFLIHHLVLFSPNHAYQIENPILRRENKFVLGGGFSFVELAQKVV